MIVLSLLRNPRGLEKLVGARGFEPPTPCAQGRCATRLRYAPTVFHYNCDLNAIINAIRIDAVNESDIPGTSKLPVCLRAALSL